MEILTLKKYYNRGQLKLSSLVCVFLAPKGFLIQPGAYFDAFVN
jgi:hypothetical protein